MSSFTLSLYVDKTSEVAYPVVYSVVNNAGPLVSQQINITASMETAITNGLGLGTLFIKKVTNIDQPGNTYATWEYTFNFSGTGGYDAGTITGEIDLLNNTSWPDKFSTSSNPTELILPSGAQEQQYNGFVKSGTGPYYGASGFLNKIKNATQYRLYTLIVTLPN
jgi:hypothetical protein